MRVSARARVRGRGSKQHNTRSGSARNSQLPPWPESAPRRSLEVSRRGEGRAGFVAVQTDCTYLERCGRPISA